MDVLGELQRSINALLKRRIASDPVALPSLLTGGSQIEARVWTTLGISKVTPFLFHHC